MGGVSSSRNAVRSQRLIREAFLALVEEHGDGKITVVDLCRKADINRTTFYAHYESLDDLEYKLWNMYLDDLTSWLSAELNQGFLDNPTAGLNRLCDILVRNHPLYELFITRHVMERFGSVWWRGGFGLEVRNALLKALEPLDELNNVWFDYTVSSLFGMYRAWFAGLYDSQPLSELNEQFARFIVASLPASAE